MGGADRAVGERAVTAIMPIWRIWSPWLRVVFWLGPRVPLLARNLPKLGFIHEGHWTIVRRWPTRDGWVKAHRPELLFATNWHGFWRPYIEDFARVMPWQWRGIWTGAKDFPGPIPVSDLFDWIEQIDAGADHYYSAHADSSVREIQSALRVAPALDRLRAEHAGASPDAFATAWRQFLRDHQLDL
jgi:hypothetical protein